MENVVVTGATSFIGRSLVKRLLDEKCNVYAVIRPDSDKRKMLPQSKNLKTITLDMDSYKELSSIKDIKCDTFICLSWQGTRGQQRNDGELQKRNYLNCMDAVKCAAELGAKTIVTAGSQAEYGRIDETITEETFAHPDTAYGKYKLKLYGSVRDLCMKKGIRFIEPRFFSIYGPGDYDGSMTMSVVQKMLNDEPCNLTECTQLWDYIYIDDAVQAVMALLRSNTACGIYNIAEGISKPLKEYIYKMHIITKSKSKLNLGSVAYGPQGPVNLKADISKIKDETGFAPHISFEQGIKNTIEFIKGERS